jgi:hypothetical protein
MAVQVRHNIKEGHAGTADRRLRASVPSSVHLASSWTLFIIESLDTNAESEGSYSYLTPHEENVRSSGSSPLVSETAAYLRERAPARAFKRYE